MKIPGPIVWTTVASCLSFPGNGALYSVLPTSFESMGIAPWQTGIILAANRWVRLLSNYPAEHIGHRFSVRIVFSIALAVAALSTIATAVAPLFSILLISRIVWGVSYSVIRVVGFMVIQDSVNAGIARHSERGRLVGFYEGSRMGDVLGSVVGAFGYDLLGWHLCFLIIGAISLIAVPLAWFLSRTGLVDHGDSSKPFIPMQTQVLECVRPCVHHGAGEHCDDDVAVVVAPPCRRVGNRFRLPALLFLGFVTGAVGTGLIVSSLGLVLHRNMGSVVTVWGMSIGIATVNGIVFGARWLIECLGSLMVGWAADRTSRKWAAISHFACGTLMLTICGILSAASDLTWILVFLAAILVFFVNATGAYITATAEATHLEGCLSGFVTANDFGSAVGPLLSYLYIQGGLSAVWIFATAGALYAVSIPASLIAFNRPQCDPETEIPDRDPVALCHTELQDHHHVPIPVLVIDSNSDENAVFLAATVVEPSSPTNSGAVHDSSSTSQSSPTLTLALEADNGDDHKKRLLR